jgi:hypothetical protein
VRNAIIKARPSAIGRNSNFDQSQERIKRHRPNVIYDGSINEVEIEAAIYSENHMIAEKVNGYSTKEFILSIPKALRNIKEIKN